MNLILMFLLLHDWKKWRKQAHRSLQKKQHKLQLNSFAHQSLQPKSRKMVTMFLLFIFDRMFYSLFQKTNIYLAYNLVWPPLKNNKKKYSFLKIHFFGQWCFSIDFLPFFQKHLDGMHSCFFFWVFRSLKIIQLCFKVDFVENAFCFGIEMLSWMIFFKQNFAKRISWAF